MALVAESAYKYTAPVKERSCSLHTTQAFALNTIHVSFIQQAFALNTIHVSFIQYMLHKYADRFILYRTLGRPVCMSARMFIRAMQTVNRMNARPTSLHADENISEVHADCQPNERSAYQSACRREHFPERCRLSTE
jgi:hypothetical protein